MQKEEIRTRIINDIAEHRLGAVLYLRAFNILCHPNLDNPISEHTLIDILIDMIKVKELDVVIPDPFLIRWELQTLNNLKYLKDGTYYTMKFHYIDDILLNNGKKNEPLIDTRNIKATNIKILDSITLRIENILKKFPEMREKIILVLPNNENPIKLHFIDNYLERDELISNSLVNNPTSKVSILRDSSLVEQEEAVDVIKKYRRNFMCVYITLLETIKKEMTYLQKYKFKIDNYMELFFDTLDAFKSYSIMFAEEAWTEDSIQVQKRVTIKTGRLYYSSITYKEDLFLIEGYQEYWALFNKQEHPRLEDFLLKSGYDMMGVDDETNLTRVGKKLMLEFSFTTIEQIFFLCKYIFIANLFHLLFLIRNFFKSGEDFTELKEKKDNLSEIFLPILHSLFNIEKVEPLDSMTFAFLDANSKELNILYNKYLFYNARDV